MAFFRVSVIDSRRTSLCGALRATSLSSVVQNGDPAVLSAPGHQLRFFALINASGSNVSAFSGTKDQSAIFRSVIFVDAGGLGSGATQSQGRAAD